MKMNGNVSDTAADMLFASEEHLSYFKINGPERTSEILDVPDYVMHRIFRIAQAYNLRGLRYLEPESAVVIGSFDIPEFIKNLNDLLPIINDDEIHKYVNELLIAINKGGTSSNKNVAIKTGNYYEKRRRT